MCRYEAKDIYSQLINMDIHITKFKYRHGQPIPDFQKTMIVRIRLAMSVRLSQDVKYGKSMINNPQNMIRAVLEIIFF